MRHFIGILMLWGFIGVLFPAPADEGFADTLFKKGEYHWADLEYSRLIFTFPDSSNAPHWYFRRGICKSSMNRPAQSMNDFTTLFSHQSLGDSARLFASVSALHIERIDQARSFLSGCRLDFGQVLLAYTYFYTAEYASADTIIAALAADSPMASKAQSLALLIDDSRSYHKKRYSAALLLSVVPGLGHVYTRRYSDALKTAMTVFAGAFLTGYYALNDARPETYASGILTGVFYAGGMYGALVSVKIYNKRESENRHRQAERIVFGK